jgi:hypothetical protein
MMIIPFASSGLSLDCLPPQSRAERARQEQAFYEQVVVSSAWKTALMRLSVPLMFALVGALAGLSTLIR